MVTKENSFLLKKKDKNLMNFFSLDKNLSDENKIIKIDLMLKEDNTQEEIVLEYLLLKEKTIKNENSLISKLQDYEDAISEEKFNFNFSKYYSKISTLQKIFILLNDLSILYSSKNIDEKISIINKIFELKIIKYIPTFPIYYKYNHELYFGVLYYLVVRQIQKRYDKIKKNNFGTNLNEIIVQFKKNIKANESYDNNERLMDCIKNYLNKLYDYIINLSKFMSKVMIKFTFRFDNNVFKNNPSEKDINLFTDFMFYLFSYNFEKYDPLYESIWNDSLVHENLRDVFIPIVSYKHCIEKNYNNNSIRIKIDDLDFTINNINDYCIEPLLNYILLFKVKPNVCTLNNYLRIDKYDSCLFLKKAWEKLADYISDILTSPVINSIFSLVCEKENENEIILFHCFNKYEIKEIINNIRFFNFKSDFSGSTKSSLLLIYAQANMQSDYEESISILIYIIKILIILIHEIIGHLNIRYQQYLNNNFKNIKLKSPKPEEGSEYANKRGAESGEFVEEQLFGNYEGEMTLGQILFVLDIQNYKESNHESFREKFKNCKTLQIKDISNELKEILALFNIKLSDEDFENNKVYSVQKNIKKNKYYVGTYHAMDFDIDE